MQLSLPEAEDKEQHSHMRKELQDDLDASSHCNNHYHCSDYDQLHKLPLHRILESRIELLIQRVSTILFDIHSLSRSL